MKHTSASACAAITELLDDWRQAFDNHRPVEIAALFTPDARFQGISPRLRIGRAEITGYYSEVADGARATVEVLDGMLLADGSAAGFAGCDLHGVERRTLSHSALRGGTADRDGHLVDLSVSRCGAMTSHGRRAPRRAHCIDPLHTVKVFTAYRTPSPSSVQRARM
ncbi:YybH family protein [Streptomyces sp. NPDC013457]|uniref:YybH family protein n=1 Tax=Streptomyces sp. NPDC013457 TaxID=3364866 RepID=UPI0036F54E13